MSKLTKKECEKVLNRIMKPFWTSTNVQKIYHLCNGERANITDDFNLFEILIKEHFELIEEAVEIKKALDIACGELEKLESYCMDSEEYTHTESCIQWDCQEWKDWCINESRTYRTKGS